jgi:anti-sigma B factor antagonist
MDEHLRIEIRNGTEPVEVTLIGEIDLATEGQVVEALSGVAGHEVIVDLSRVEYIDSSGLRALIMANKNSETAGGSLALRSPASAAARVLEMTGISKCIKIVD